MENLTKQMIIEEEIDNKQKKNIAEVEKTKIELDFSKKKKQKFRQKIQPKIMNMLIQQKKTLMSRLK